MKNVTNIKIITAILIPMVLISTASYGYAHWTDSITKRYKLHVRCTQTKIKTNKVLTDWVDDQYIIKIPSDLELEAMDGTYTLSISTNRACPGFDVWIGFMLHNQAEREANGAEMVYPPIFTVTQDPPNSVSYEYSSFTYGIFSQGDFTDYYAGINRKNFRDALDPSKGIVDKTPIDPPLPRVIEPCNKLVIWTYLKIIDGHPEFTVQIEIAVHTEFA